MNIFTMMKEGLSKMVGAIGKTPMRIKVLTVLIMVAASWGVRLLITRSQVKTVQYQTAKVVKGVLTTSISGTGTISSGNNTDITTAATGTVKEVYVINGDNVTKGQKIAELTLDEYGQQQQSYYYAKYVDALHAVKVASQTKDEDDIAMWKARQDILDAEDDINTKNLSGTNPDTGKEWTLSERTVVDKTLDKARKAYDAAEFKYKNDDANIAKANSDVIAAWKNYQEVSSTIYAPAAGEVNNLSLAKGVVISSSSKTVTTSQSSSTSTSITSQELGKIYDSEGQLQASVSLTESDVITIKPNQKVSLTLDAYSDKTFTGSVLAVNTTGTVTSGVTTYPVTILLDKTSELIYPNMATSVDIITDIKNGVLLVDSAALYSENGKTVAYTLKNGKASLVEVTTGDSDDSQTEIIKGLSEGDVVITNYISANDASQNNTSSAFSSTSRTSTKSTNKSTFGGSSIGGMGGGMGGGIGGPPGM